MSGLRRGKGLRKQDSLDLDAVLKEYESEPSEGKTPREQMDDIGTLIYAHSCKNWSSHICS